MREVLCGLPPGPDVAEVNLVKFITEHIFLVALAR